MLISWATSAFLHKEVALRERFGEVATGGVAILAGITMVIFSLWSCYIYFNSLKKHGIQILGIMTGFLIFALCGVGIQFCLFKFECSDRTSAIIVLLGMAILWPILKVIELGINIQTNQRVDPTVKTPVESGNEQGTAGHP